MCQNTAGLHRQGLLGCFVSCSWGKTPLFIASKHRAHVDHFTGQGPWEMKTSKNESLCLESLFSLGVDDGLGFNACNTSKMCLVKDVKEIRLSFS